MLRNRYRRIIIFFARILASIIFWDLLLPSIGLKKWSRSTRSERYRKIAKRYRNLAVEMGEVLIKVGQFLSVRVDVLPEEVTAELSGLQDEVPSENFDDIKNVIETEFGLTLSEKYFDFDPIPLAAASLGQAHLAKIKLTHEQSELLDTLNSE